MRNAEGKMRNGMCGATVIGRDVTPREPHFRISPHAVRRVPGCKMHTEHAENHLLHSTCNFEMLLFGNR